MGKFDDLSRDDIIKAIKELVDVANIELEITPHLIRTVASDPQTRQKAISLMAKYFLKNERILTLMDTDEIHIYHQGVYVGSGERTLSKKAQKILKEYAGIHFINEVLGDIKRETYVARETIEEPKDKLCLENGILNINSLEIEDHDPSTVFFNKIPVIYVKEADCPNIKKFLREVVAREEDILNIQELIGYCLYKSYLIHKAFMLLGGGANGKSTLINLIRAFLGSKNCSSIPLQQLENDRFSLSSLYGKLVNVFADLSPRALRESSFFKMLTGEDQIPAEKKFKDKFFFLNYAKMIFSANQLPKSPDDSDAFFRRWIIILFPNQFMNDKADKKLIEKLTTKEEMGGLLNFAIEGLKRLLEKGDFSETKSVAEVRENYIRQSDSVSAFQMDCIVIKSDGEIEKKKLYTSYADYCREKGYPTVPENTFHRDLQRIIRVEDYRPRRDGQRVQCWKGISLLNMENNPDMVDNIDQNKINGQTGQGGQGKLPF